MKKPRLGQHFLKARFALHTLVHAARIAPTDTVLEVGPGTGNLTTVLLANAKRVIAIEKDPALITVLRERFPDAIREQKLLLFEGDIRDVDLQTFGTRDHEYILAANIPYYITGEIIRMFLTNKVQPSRAALLIQKEVAQRIARSKKESILSLSVKVFGTPRYIKTVPARSFSPPPKVDSAILLIDEISRTHLTEVSEERFFKLVKAGFSSKRKKLAGNLKTISDKGKITEAFLTCGVPENARAEDVPLSAWQCLARKIS